MLFTKEVAFHGLCKSVSGAPTHHDTIPYRHQVSTPPPPPPPVCLSKWHINRILFYIPRLFPWPLALLFCTWNSRWKSMPNWPGHVCRDILRPLPSDTTTPRLSPGLATPAFRTLQPTMTREKFKSENSFFNDLKNIPFNFKFLQNKKSEKYY